MSHEVGTSFCLDMKVEVIGAWSFHQHNMCSKDSFTYLQFSFRASHSPIYQTQKLRCFAHPNDEFSSKICGQIYKEILCP